MSHSHATQRHLTTMTAVVQDTYGPPETLRVDDVATPTPKHDEVLVRVHATAVTPADCAFRQGVPLATRLFNGLRRPKHILGDLFAGQIAGVGEYRRGLHRPPRHLRRHLRRSRQVVVCLDGVCTSVSILFEPVELPLLQMYSNGGRLITGRPHVRTLLPEINLRTMPGWSGSIRRIWGASVRA